MPSAPHTPRVKLRAATRRVPRARVSEAAAEAEPEPVIKLSRAIMVMLLLHVVAVGGVFAFSIIKDRNATGRANDGSPTITEAEDLRVPSSTTNRVTAVESERSKADAPGGVTRSGVHVVRPGETLTLIANNTGVPVDAIVAANGTNTVTNRLKPGQELKLPDKYPAPTPAPSNRTAEALQAIAGKTSASPGNVAAPAKNHLPPDSGKTYTVGKGESPYTIAHKLKISYDDLLKLNQIDDPKKLKLGQKLRVPAAAKSKS